MKICPTCKRSYADDLLNFCLDDGSVLTTAGNPSSNIYLNQARPTAITPPSPLTADMNYLPAQAVAPKKSSKRGGLWALGILAVIVLFCGGGIALFGLMIANTPVDNSNTSIANSANNNWTNDNPSTGKHTVDLSDWAGVRDDGTLQAKGSENVMWSKLKGHYFVMVAPQSFSTVGSNTSLTVRNINDENTSIGFGLVFHSNVRPLKQDYAFLIDSKRKRYRIVRHQDLKESDIVKWTVSSAIKDGDQKNILEVHDLSGMMEFYINGTKLTTIRNEAGAKNGVPGLYAGDAVKIGFSDMTVSN
jgi:hypothetical protein